MSAFVVATMYKFVPLPEYRELREPLQQRCRDLDLRGTLLLAEEGINGTIAGSRAAIDSLLLHLRADPRLADLEHKESSADESPFHRLKVKLKKEIVTMGVAAIDPSRQAGTKVDAAEWNRLISDPEVLVIDTRNDYECSIGQFDNAQSPGTRTFREFPDYVRRRLNPLQHKKIAMYCTGGIRCEKATSYLKEQGFDQVYHLNGGILKYLEQVTRADSTDDNLWRGECFVFDGRVAVDENLQQGSHRQCYACRQPLTAADRASDRYCEGISCPYCFDGQDARKRARVTERQRQVELARQRSSQHIGLPSELHHDGAARPTRKQ